MPPTEPVDAPVDLDKTPEKPVEDAPAPARPRPAQSPALPIAIALAAVFAVTSVLLAVVAVGYKADRDDLADETTEIQAAASRFVQTFVDFDSSDPASEFDDVLPLTAGTFTDQYTDAREAVIAYHDSLGQTSARATINEVLASAVVNDEATAIVTYDAVSTFETAEPLLGENLYLRLGLIRIDGEWKVNELINLNLALEGGNTPAPPVVGDETTTTAPPG